MVDSVVFDKGTFHHHHAHHLWANNMPSLDCVGYHLLEDGALSFSSANLVVCLSPCIAQVSPLRRHQGCKLSTVVNSSIHRHKPWRSKLKPTISKNFSTFQTWWCTSAFCHHPSTVIKRSHANHAQHTVAIAKCIATFKNVSSHFIVEDIWIGWPDNRSRLRLSVLEAGFTFEVSKSVDDFWRSSCNTQHSCHSWSARMTGHLMKPSDGHTLGVGKLHPFLLPHSIIFSYCSISFLAIFFAFQLDLISAVLVKSRWCQVWGIMNHVQTAHGIFFNHRFCRKG